MRRVAALCVVLVLAGCGDSDRPSPSDTDKPASTPATQKLSETELVVQTMWQALEQGDCAAVKRVVVTPSAIDCAQLGEAAGMFVAEGIDLGAARYEDDEMAGDSATVTIIWNDTLPAETIDVQRVDGEWLVIFDSSP